MDCTIMHCKHIVLFVHYRLYHMIGIGIIVEKAPIYFSVGAPIPLTRIFSHGTPRFINTLCCLHVYAFVQTTWKKFVSGFYLHRNFFSLLGNWAISWRLWMRFRWRISLLLVKSFYLPLLQWHHMVIAGYHLTENPLFMLPESQATVQSAKSSI